MDVIDINKLYNINKKKIPLTAEIPVEIYKLTLELFDDAYYYGLQGLTLEEYLGALIIAGICISTPNERWNYIIPIHKEDYTTTHNQTIH